MLVEGAFRGVSNSYLLSQEHDVVINPPRHFNFIFYPNNFERKNKIITEF